MLTNSIPQTKAAQVFLTSQSSEMYKQLEVFSSQLQPPKNINAWNYEEIESHMLNIFNLVHFVVREGFKFWTECKSSRRDNSRAGLENEKGSGNLRFYKNL